MRLAGRAAVVLAVFALVSGASSFNAGAKSFGVSSAKNGSEAYIEDNTFGTNREGGPAFVTDPTSGDRRFRTPEMPKKQEPEEIEILPVRPEVRPQVQPPKAPIIIEPGS